MSLTSRRTVMARKRYKPEEIVAKLRQVDVLVSQGQNLVDAIRQIGVSEVTFAFLAAKAAMFPNVHLQLRDVEAGAQRINRQLIVLSAGTERDIDTAIA